MPQECAVADNIAPSPTTGRADKVVGAILGTAVGDALGLPREGLSRRRARQVSGDPPLRRHFLFGRGMVSDDTEHTCMTGQALLRAPEDVDAFARSLAWRLRFGLLGLPAGTGWATLRAVLKLWLGFSPRQVVAVPGAGTAPGPGRRLFRPQVAGTEPAPGLLRVPRRWHHLELLDINDPEPPDLLLLEVDLLHQDGFGFLLLLFEVVTLLLQAGDLLQELVDPEGVPVGVRSGRG
jgi:hypothetical protein